MKSKKEYNRAIIVFVLALLPVIWVLTNSPGWGWGSNIYIVMGLVLIISYLNWDKIRIFGK